LKIEVEKLSKSFGALQVLREIDLEARPGELLALLGPSGCGKTTLLRIIAGLETADEGRILFNSENVTGRAVRDRKLGFVFQHYALFRHMNVFENVAFGLRVRPRDTRPPKAEIRRRVEELLRLVRLEAQAAHLPSQLSGGQRQRVALARALAVEPAVLLLDEPFGSLDAQVRRELRTWVRRLHDDLHLTSIFVTHDQEEALELADRVAVINEGRVVQVGTPEEIYQRPADPFVFHFLGSVNLFHSRVSHGVAYLGDTAVRSSLSLPDGPATVYIRPHCFDLVLDGEPAAGRGMPARILHVHAAGPTVKLELSGDGGEAVQVEMSHERFTMLGAGPGAAVRLVVREEHVFVSPVLSGAERERK